MLKRPLFMPVIAFVILLTFQPIAAQSSTPKITWTQVSQERTASVGISPDGKQIIFGSSATKQLTVMDWQTKKVVWQVSQYIDTVSTSNWSPDGKYIATLSGGSIYIYEVATGHHVSQIESSLNAYEDLLGLLTGSASLGFGYTDLKWNADGGQLAVMVYGYILICNLPSGTITTVVDLVGLPLPNDLHTYLSWFDWSPDGSKFAAFHYKIDDKGQVPFPLDIVMGFWDKNGYLLPDKSLSSEPCVPDGQEIFNGFASPVGEDIAWAPDNKTVVVIVDTIGGNLHSTICTLQSDGKLLVKELSDPIGGEIHWSSDQKWLFGMDTGCDLFITDVANNYTTNIEHFAETCDSTSSNWSQNGQQVVIGGGDGLWVGTVQFP